MIVRPEEPPDAPAVRDIHERAFGRAAEADIVDALRAAGAITLSLVAEEDGGVIGHVLFSPVTVRGAEDVRATGLASLAVVPEHQRAGVGGALVREGLERLRADGWAIAVVLGDPAYYSRFGFEPASRFGVRWEHDAPDEAFQLLELRPGALAGRSGVVAYRPEIA